MKRGMIVFLALVALPSAFADGFSLSNILFGMKTLPVENGSGFDGYLGYKFSDAFSTEVLLKNVYSAATSEPEFTDDNGASLSSKALNLVRQNVTEIFVLPVEYSIKAGGFGKITFSAGAYISMSSEKNVGFMKFVPAVNSGATNSYDADTATTFWGPLITLEDSLDLGFVSFRPRVLFVPYFWFHEKRSLSIDPMYESFGIGKLAYDSSGSPYFSISLDDISIPLNRILPIRGLSIGADIAYESQKYDTRYITDTSTATVAQTEWGEIRQTNTNTTFSFMGAIGFTFENGSDIRFGFGQKREVATEYNKETKKTVTTPTTSPMYSISYNLKR
jgi:hypothetical protein